MFDSYGRKIKNGMHAEIWMMKNGLFVIASFKQKLFARLSSEHSQSLNIYSRYFTINNKSKQHIQNLYNQNKIFIHKQIVVGHPILAHDYIYQNNPSLKKLTKKSTS